MIALIITGLAFVWLGYETDWMRVRLRAGELKVKRAGYRVYSTLSKRKCLGTAIHKGGNIEWQKYTDVPVNGDKVYDIVVSAGLDNVLCGFDWLDRHCADLVDYEPKVEMLMGGVRYNMTIKQPAIIKDIMRVNKLTRKQKLAYA